MIADEDDHRPLLPGDIGERVGLSVGRGQTKIRSWRIEGGFLGAYGGHEESLVRDGCAWYGAGTKDFDKAFFLAVRAALASLSFPRGGLLIFERARRLRYHGRLFQDRQFSSFLPK